MAPTAFEPTIAARESPQPLGSASYIIWSNYNNQIIIIEFLLQGCVTESVRLKLQCEMRVAEKRGLSFRAFSGETGGRWRRWHNEDFYARRRV